MRRIVAAGHELCNHMPHDRSYALLGEPAFAADLRAAEEALQRRSSRTQLPPPSARTWFRPPMGAMSCAMARVLQREGYSPLLGDVFSNDVFVGGGGRKAGDAGWRRDGGVACGVLCTAHQAGVGGHLSHAAGA